MHRSSCWAQKQQELHQEAKIKFGKVPDTGKNIPSINVQHCRAFVKMEQQKPFRFDEQFPHLWDYSTINSMDAKAPVILRSKNSFNAGRTWLSYINEDDCWSPLEEDTEDLNEAWKKGERWRQTRQTSGFAVSWLSFCKRCLSTEHQPIYWKILQRWCWEWAWVSLLDRGKTSCYSFPKIWILKWCPNTWEWTLPTERHGDKEVKIKITFPHTDVPSVSLRYLLKAIHSWLQLVTGQEHLAQYVRTIERKEAFRLSSLLQKVAQDLIKVSTPLLSIIPIYEKCPSDLLNKFHRKFGDGRFKELELTSVMHQLKSRRRMHMQAC